MVDPSCAGQTTFVVCPNCSLTWRGLIAFYAPVLLFAGSIAVAFALLGYRPVLPFAGLELVALGTGLFVTRLRCDRRELIRIGDDTIFVAGNGPCEHLPAAWTRVCEHTDHNTDNNRFSLAVHGRELETGRVLTERERTSLAMQLREALAPRTAWSMIS